MSDPSAANKVTLHSRFPRLFYFFLNPSAGRCGRRRLRRSDRAAAAAGGGAIHFVFAPHLLLHALVRLRRRRTSRDCRLRRSLKHNAYSGLRPPLIVAAAASFFCAITTKITIGGGSREEKIPSVECEAATNVLTTELRIKI